jgi:FtsP/CotA-like multicopper oxidase with cupredoxin domain
MTPNGNATPRCSFNDCQGYHKNSHFGDINMVSGIPFPKMAADAKWHRFRILNAALARPWLLSLVDKFGKDVSASACYVLASDGGYRRTPAPFPSNRLFIGVAERYEVWVAYLA